MTRKHFLGLLFSVVGLFSAKELIDEQDAELRKSCIQRLILDIFLATGFCRIDLPTGKDGTHEVLTISRASQILPKIQEVEARYPGVGWTPTYNHYYPPYKTNYTPISNAIEHGTINFYLN